MKQLKILTIFVSLFFLPFFATAHTNNVRYLLAEWGLTSSPFDYNSDTKVNTPDFVVDAVHTHSTVTPLPSASTSPQWPQISFNKVASGLAQPINITSPKDSTNRLFINEQAGTIRIVKNNTLLATPFLNISSKIACCGERGLLGLAFPPNYGTKKYFYVHYSNLQGHTVIARYRTNANNPDLADPTSEQILLTVTQPYANHNGGQIAFGPDGYLYIGLGDGGSGGDPQNRAQNPNELLGKLLRIDVESNPTSNQYQIPASNPFYQTTGYKKEIWALGLRNPWRFSFDSSNGDLFIADVGQGEIEEIDYQSGQSLGGENYGWRIMEGLNCYNPTSNCPTSGLTMPVTQYTHGLGCSVTGGTVYRGLQYPTMSGMYFYGDYCSGRVWGLKKSGTSWQTMQLVDTEYTITTFGENDAKELFLADYGSGDIYQIQALP